MDMKWLEKKVFRAGLTNPTIFRRTMRPIAYYRAGGDPEKVHELALETLQEYGDVIEDAASEFCFPDLEVSINGKYILPFGTAAGLDKNADALRPLSHLFGFQEVGTIVMHKREGNARPRIAVDNNEQDIYNAQGFPSKGLPYAKNNLQKYRDAGGSGVIFASICGIPPSPDELGVAYGEAEVLLDELDQLVDGFVWNPFSPNTAALAALRTPETFEKYAQRVKRTADKRLALVKMGPYDSDPEKKERWLDLVRGWREGGGDGIVAVNTYLVPKEQIPSSGWGYQSAGKSGRFLQEYRQRAIRDARASFPDVFIVAAGGIDSVAQAYGAFEAGANLVEGYTPYTFHGFGLLRSMESGLISELHKKGYGTLREFQERQR